MSGTADPWAAFPIVQNAAPPAPAADPWAAFPVVQPPAADPPNPVGSFIRGVARGATLNTADEIGATVFGMLGRDRNQMLGVARRMNAEDDATNPLSSLAGQVAGGVLMPLGPLGRFAASAPSMGGAIIRGGLVGGLLGGAAGMGDAEGSVSDRLPAAGAGAALGAAVGGAAPVAMAAGGALVNRLAGNSGPETQARRLLLRDIGRDGMTPDELARRAEQAGATPMAIADLGGENVRGAAQVVGRLPGPGRDAAGRMLAERGGAAQGERLAENVRTLVSNADFRATADSIIARQQNAATPAYNRAFAESGPVDVAPILSDLTTRIGEAKGGIRTALERARGFLLDPDGNPDTRIAALHQAKLAIDDMLSGGAEKPVGRVARRELVQIQRSLVDAMDAASTKDGVSLYATARAQFAGPAGVLDAMETGRGLLRESPQAFERTAAEIRAMPAAEREGLRIGLARGLLDRIGTAADAQEATRIRQLFGSPAVRERVRAAFDSEAEFNAFARALENEAQIAATNRAVAPNGGSPTMPMQERRADLASPPPGPVVSALRNPDAQDFGAPSGAMIGDVVATARAGGVTAAPFRLAERIGQSMQARGLERNTAAMAPMLFATNPAERQRYAAALVEQALRDAQIRRFAAPLGQGLLRGSALAGGLLSPEPGN